MACTSPGPAGRACKPSVPAGSAPATARFAKKLGEPFHHIFTVRPAPDARAWHAWLSRAVGAAGSSCSTTALEQVQAMTVSRVQADSLGYAKPDRRAFDKALAIVKDREGIAQADVLLVAQSQVRNMPAGRQQSLVCTGKGCWQALAIVYDGHGIHQADVLLAAHPQAGASAAKRCWQVACLSMHVAHGPGDPGALAFVKDGEGVPVVAQSQVWARAVSWL